jgi:hypothetical protein
MKAFPKVTSTENSILYFKKTTGSLNSRKKSSLVPYHSPHSRNAKEWTEQIMEKNGG